MYKIVFSPDHSHNTELTMRHTSLSSDVVLTYIPMSVCTPQMSKLYPASTIGRR